QAAALGQPRRLQSRVAAATAVVASLFNQSLARARYGNCGVWISGKQEGLAPTHFAMRIATPTASAFLPEKHDLTSLREAAKHCEGCPLYANATQTVFGAGPARAEVMMVGEQPGDVEDRQGKPFVGPAGRLLDQMLEEAGIPRQRVYV